MGGEIDHSDEMRRQKTARYSVELYLAVFLQTNGFLHKFTLTEKSLSTMINDRRKAEFEHKKGA